METTENLLDSQEDIAARGMEMVRRSMDRLEMLIRERPGTALLAALGLGFVIGRIVRR